MSDERRQLGVRWNCALGHVAGVGVLGGPAPESCQECDRLAREADRRENPLGIQVMEFGPDPDVSLATKAGFDAGRESERSRIRALILKHYANDWTANELLKEVDRG